MKRLGVFVPLALAGACGSKAPAMPAERDVAFELALPHGALDPSGFTAVDVTLHEPGKNDVELSATIGADGTFDLGTIDPIAGVSIEATLRNDSGAAVGYGRITGAAFGDGGMITVPVRRPITYIAGPDDDDQRSGPAWTPEPATYSDLSTGAPLDGKTVLASPAALMVAAGPNLYMVTQAIDGTTGALTGMAQVAPVSTSDHTVGAALAGALAGAVVDGAGTDDGKQLVIATTTALYAIDTATGAAAMLATGSFSHVAILTSDAGEVDAIAIKNRAATTGACATTAELWWAPLAGGMVHMIATGGFSDVAADRGQAYYVDACKRELGTVTATGATMLRSLAGTITATAEPTMLAVSNAQAYIGLEDQPATTSLVVASTSPTANPADPPRTLWTEVAQQVVEASLFPGVLRQLSATSIVFDHLEVGGGGDYVALTTSAHFHGPAVGSANFPDITMDAEELRVFDASTGGSVQRYRSWCSGLVQQKGNNDIPDWRCALALGQTSPAAPPQNSPITYDHHINSMTFMFGKK